jgi:acyl-CoA thioesterase-1
MVADPSRDPGRERARRRCRHRAYGPASRLVNAARRAALAVFCAALGLGTAAPAAAAKLLALGDSLTAGFGLPPEQGFTARLEAALGAKGAGIEVINAGISGDTTAGGLARLDWALADHPDFALVELGANDALRGFDPKETRANLDRILARLQAAHVKALLCGMKAPRNWGLDYTEAFEAIYPDLATKYGVPLYPFLLDGVALDRTLNQTDMLHPNAAGVDVIVARLLPSVEKLIGPGS